MATIEVHQNHSHFPQPSIDSSGLDRGPNVGQRPQLLTQIFLDVEQAATLVLRQQTHVHVAVVDAAEAAATAPD